MGAQSMGAHNCGLRSIRSVIIRGGGSHRVGDGKDGGGGNVGCGSNAEVVDGEYFW